MFPTGGVAIFNLALFLARYPEFSQVNPGKLQEYFCEAGLYLSNRPTSRVQNLQRRLILLNMLVAHISYLAGDLDAIAITPVAPSIVLSVFSPNAGAFTIAHGLGVVPNSLEIVPTSGGAIWQSAPPDATNLYLSASDIGVTATVNVFQNAQVASSGGKARPVGRTSAAAEGSVSASLDYMQMTPGSGPWFNQTSAGAEFWAATASLRSAIYIPGYTRY